MINLGVYVVCHPRQGQRAILDTIWCNMQPNTFVDVMAAKLA